VPVPLPEKALSRASPGRVRVPVASA